MYFVVPLIEVIEHSKLVKALVLINSCDFLNAHADFVHRVGV
jgi:hypothetical protein